MAEVLALEVALAAEPLAYHLVAAYRLAAAQRLAVAPVFLLEAA